MPDRITPACAGISATPGTTRAWKQDHPRVRGDKAAAWFQAHEALGSPPRARG